MEMILNTTDQLINEMTDLLKRWEQNEIDFDKLMTYYGSEDWHQDRQSDDDQLIPEDLPRGVLSEDSVYDTFGSRKDTAINMIKTGVKSLE